MSTATAGPSHEALAKITPVRGRVAERILLGALLAWGLAPIVLMAWHALSAHLRLTGADGIIGADQLQYLAWTRDAGAHGLAANLFEIAPGGHVYAQPLFTLSGALWRLGLPIAAAYWLWKPVAVLILFAGAAAFTARAFSRARSGSRLAALTLSLFMLAPIASLLAWVHIFSLGFRTDALTLGAEMFPAGQLWGYLPSAIAIGLLAIALLSVERLLAAPAAGRRPMAVACGTALLISWLHPWQGVTLILILLGLAIWDRRRAVIRLAGPALAAAVPLGYYLALSRFDSAWKLAAHNEVVPRPGLAALAVVLAPLLLLAGAGIRRPGRDSFERALLLWVPAGLITYGLVSSFPSHGLESLSLPLAVLMVRGWQRLRLSAVLGVAALCVVTLPGIVYDARTFSDTASGPLQEYYIGASDAHALDWVRTRAPRGGVLAPPLFAIVVPSQTGRAVWVGHEFWSRDYRTRASEAATLFAGAFDARTAQSLVRRSGARLVLADCAHPAPLAPRLGTTIVAIHRFGCASVYVVRAP
jgi:hypothetical protein